MKSMPLGVCVARLFDTREAATVLAALRMYQRRAFGVHAGTLDTRNPEYQIATDGGTLDPLDSEEIDQMIEELNDGRDLTMVKG